MHQLINKKKIYFYIFSFFILVTISNDKVTFVKNEIFLVREINIETNSTDLKKKILFQIGQLRNKNIFFLKNEEILSNLKSLNFLEDISIKKVYPSTIVINTKETNLLASTYFNQKKYFVGENGKFINSALVQNKSKLPIIFGQFRAKDFLNLKKNLLNNKINENNIIKYYFHKTQRWDLYFNNNIIIKLPSKNVVNAIKLYKNFINQNPIKSGAIIDLRINNRLILKNE